MYDYVKYNYLTDKQSEQDFISQSDNLIKAGKKD